MQLVFDDGTFVRLAGTTRLAEGPDVEEPQSLEGLAILLPLLNESVVSAGVVRGGALALAFDAGVLTCGPDAKYEAWEFTTRAGTLVVCMEGGALAIWFDDQRAGTPAYVGGDAPSGSGDRKFHAPRVSFWHPCRAARSGGLPLDA